MTIASIIALMLVSSLCYRIRGSSFFSTWPKWFFGVARGDRLIKLAIGAAPVALATWLVGVPAPWALAVWAGVMAMDTLPHAAFQGTTNEWQILGMTALGIACATPPALVMALYAPCHCWPAPLALGLLCGPAYFAGNRLPINLGNPRNDMAMSEGPVNGEWFYGATRVLFLAVTLTAG